MRSGGDEDDLRRGLGVRWKRGKIATLAIIIPIGLACDSFGDSDPTLSAVSNETSVGEDVSHVEDTNGGCAGGEGTRWRSRLMNNHTLM